MSPALTPANQAGKVYELAGDAAYTLAEYAAEIARQSGRPVVYKDLPEADYKAALQAAGLPEALAALYAESDVRAAEGALLDGSRQLSRLIGRPTTIMARSVDRHRRGRHDDSGNGAAGRLRGADKGALHWPHSGRHRRTEACFGQPGMSRRGRVTPALRAVSLGNVARRIPALYQLR